MEDFRQQFLIDAVINLRDLRRNLSGATELSDAERRGVFRLLHTIKGTAQTFGFSAASRLAHELENILSAVDVLAFEDFQSLFVEGVEHLINSFEVTNFQFPTTFTERIHLLVPKKLQSSMETGILPPEIPSGISERLSQTEKLALSSAFDKGANIYVIKVCFPKVKSFPSNSRNFGKT